MERKMTIEQLRVVGFRSLKSVVWHPGRLNVVIGPNGSGKSNLLRSLELLSIAAQGRMGRYVQAKGGIEPLLWDGSADRLDFEVTTSPLDDHQSSHPLTYELTLSRLGAGSSYRIDQELLGDYHLVQRQIKAEPLKHIERRQYSAKIFNESNRSLEAPPEDIIEDETLLSQAAGPFTGNKVIGPFQKEIGSWAIHHDIHVNSDAQIRQPIVTRSEQRVVPDGQNLIAVLHTLYTGDRDFKSTVNSAMTAAFGSDFEELVFPPAADQRIQMRVRWKSLRREQSTFDLSDGTLRFLFLLTVLATPSPAPLIAIDEPEAGLHPSMLPIIAEQAVDASLRSQVIFTTHSDQFLDAFTDIQPTTTVVKWSNGETTLRTLDGPSLDDWVKRYSLGTLYRSGELESEAIA